jgi:dihydropyrimidinase
MSDYDLVIINGVCVTAGDVGKYDIAIKDEKIAVLAPTGSLAQSKAARVIDAEGAFIIVSRLSLCHGW